MAFETEEQKKRRILEQLRQKMAEIDELKKKLGEKNLAEDASPADAKEFLEEIEVPALEALKDTKKDKKKNTN